MAYPTLAEVRDWIGVPASVLSDEQLELIIEAETYLQAAYCLMPVGTFPAELREALLRRVAHNVAAKGLPLGIAGTEEWGPIRLPSDDKELLRLEAPWRDLVAS